MGTATATAFWLVPRAWRFTVAQWGSTVVTPLLGITPQFRHRMLWRVEDPREAALYLVLHAMARAGVPCDLALEVRGVDLIDQALQLRRGTLVIAPHTALVGFVIPWLGERGYQPTIITSNPSKPRPGTFKILLSPTFLVQVRTALRRARLVCAMVDHGPRTGRRMRLIETKQGSLYVSDAIVRVGVHCAAVTLFMSACLERGRVIVEIVSPQPAANTAEALMNSFAAFMQAHLRRVHGSD